MALQVGGGTWLHSPREITQLDLETSMDRAFIGSVVLALLLNLLLIMIIITTVNLTFLVDQKN